MINSPGFLKIVDEVRPHVKEISVDEARSKVAQNRNAVLLDVREDHEWEEGHAAQAQHLGRGILERDLEKRFPDKNVELILYCGGGYRSALSAYNAQKMGYKNVYSLAGGFKAMVASGWPTA